MKTVHFLLDRPLVDLLADLIREYLREEENKYQIQCSKNLSVLFDYYNKYIFIFFFMRLFTQNSHYLLKLISQTY